MAKFTKRQNLSASVALWVDAMEVSKHLQILPTKVINNLLKLADDPTTQDQLKGELLRRERERRTSFLHERRGRERAKAEGRLR